MVFVLLLVDFSEIVQSAGLGRAGPRSRPGEELGPDPIGDGRDDGATVPTRIDMDPKGPLGIGQVDEAADLFGDFGGVGARRQDRGEALAQFGAELATGQGVFGFASGVGGEPGALTVSAPNPLDAPLTRMVFFSAIVFSLALGRPLRQCRHWRARPGH
jgi:hypothetical protein